MTSLAVFPQLRRTLTDVMEDELYHVPSSVNNTNSNSSQHQSNGNNPNFSSIMQNYHLNNSNNSFNYKSSPTLQHSRLYRNPSALNSEEMLTIPDINNQQLQLSLQQHHQNQLQNHELSRIPSHDMYYDIPEPLPYDEDDKHIFNEYADPNLTTTNHIYRSEHNYAQPNNELQKPDVTTTDPQAPAKLLKFNDDLTLQYFTNEDDSKFVIYPVMSPNLIPEEIEDEELSDDDDDEEFDVSDNHGFTYLDNTLNDAKNPLNYQHMKYQAQQEQCHQNEIQLAMQQDQLNKLNSATSMNNSKNNNDTQKVHDDDDVIQDIESDIDRMSLDSSDDEYSSNSSVIDEDMYTPSFKTETSQSVPKTSLIKTKIRRTGSMNGTQPTTINNNNNCDFQTHTSPSSMKDVHQCHLINPSTNQPCSKQFSRPYDLIRHQETIHASRKKIFRCVVCNKLEGGLSNKTFSRGDALSRHIRVKHGLTGTEATDALQYAKDHVEYV